MPKGLTRGTLENMGVYPRKEARALNNPRKNASGCNDPTAYNAILHISKEEKADRQADEFIKIIMMLCGAYKIELVERVKFRDKTTGKIYK